MRCGVGRMGMGEECYERLYDISKGMPKKYDD